MTDVLQLESCRPPWLDAICARVNELLARPDDWDGRGGHAPSTATAHDVVAVVGLVQAGTCPLPHLAMDPDGKVELSWSGSGIRVEIEVDGSGVADVFQRVPGFVDIERRVPLVGGDFRFVAAAIAKLDPVSA